MVNPSYLPLKPFDIPPKTPVIREIEYIPSDVQKLAETYPYDSYYNHLYVSTVGLKFESASSHVASKVYAYASCRDKLESKPCNVFQARNIACKLEYRKFDSASNSFRSVKVCKSVDFWYF